MKKSLLFGLAMLTGLFSQAQGYTFSVSQAAYSDLVLSTSVTNGATWDDPSYTIPIGFTFSIYNEALTNLIINGDAGLGGLITSPNYLTAPTPLLWANGADVIDRGYDSNTGTSPTGGLSNISYLTEGSPGNRILKIEWKNVGFYSDIDDDNISTDFTNFQLWLFESTGNIEIHFGPTSVTQPTLCYDGETGPFFGIYASYDLMSAGNLSSGLELVGPADTPTAQSTTDPYTTFTTGTVSNGRVYRYTRTVAGLDEQAKNENRIIVSPNPTDGIASLLLFNELTGGSTITLTNNLGQEIRTIDVESKQNKEINLDFSGYEAGVYFVIVQNNGDRFVKKIVKK